MSTLYFYLMDQWIWSYNISLVFVLFLSFVLISSMSQPLQSVCYIFKCIRMYLAVSERKVNYIQTALNNKGTLLAQ